MFPAPFHRSMRRNYEEFGVDEYYKSVASTYRNPHLPGIRLCIISWLDRWHEMEGAHFDFSRGFGIFDMAAGSGEVTLSFREWWNNQHWSSAVSEKRETSRLDPHEFDDHSNTSPITPYARIIAADPFTSSSYSERTLLPCATMSFREIAGGHLPPMASVIQASSAQPEPFSSPFIEMIICSFALHLIEKTFELYSLLLELSTKSRWLVILAPHKRPEIKEGWGWKKWDVTSWERCPMNDRRGEYLHDRVHCRIYRSTNINAD